MPWWIWLVLALFMLGMIVAGLVYAGIYGLRALKDMSGVAEQVGERMSAMGEPAEAGDSPEPPLFTQPLSVAQERYADTYVAVLRRKAAKRERHTQAWSRWKRFNN
ncbi:hypothetical protein [Bifidobacterium sp. SO4]|uniref:hypothetical protein n=1 Tax=Bifidobacterium sp. SO4 TaxID=2809030 RepID=UPI001BDD80E9|nr:hypothetical protein [Bifidobacterium sp. SO4]MBT1170181.1 hypothetical protein [Bifidobacterium sp. SO4]